MRRVALLVVLPLLAVGLSACNPAPPCGADHRGWVRAEVVTETGRGQVAAVYMEWTTMGYGSGCYGTWAGNARPYPAPPGNGCYNGSAIGGSEFVNHANGSGVHASTRCYGAVDIEVFMGNFVPGGVMWSNCRVIGGSAALDCQAQHVT